MNPYKSQVWPSLFTAELDIAGKIWDEVAEIKGDKEKHLHIVKHVDDFAQSHDRLSSLLAWAIDGMSEESKEMVRAHRQHIFHCYVMGRANPDQIDWGQFVDTAFPEE